MRVELEPLGIKKEEDINTKEKTYTLLAGLRLQDEVQDIIFPIKLRFNAKEIIEVYQIIEYKEYKGEEK